MSVESDTPGLDTKWLKPSGLPFDEKTYENLKPHLIAATKHFYKAGMSLADALRALLKHLEDAYNWSKEQIAQLRPYIIRFMDDLKSGTIGFEELSTVDADHESLKLTSGEETREDAKRFFYRGRTKQDNGDCTGAIADFDKAIEIDPRHGKYYFRRGGAKEINGDLDGAIADYTKAIEIHPQDAFAYHSRAGAKWIMGDIESALADYDEAIEILPRYPWLYNNRGRAREANGDLYGAIADYTRAIEIDPRGIDAVYRADVAMAYALRGLAYILETGDTEAHQEFTQAIELDGSLKAWIGERVKQIRGKRESNVQRRNFTQEFKREKAWTRVAELADEMETGSVSDLDEIIARLSDDLEIIKEN